MTEVRIPLRALVPMRTFYTIPPRYQELETKKKTSRRCNGCNKTSIGACMKSIHCLFAQLWRVVGYLSILRPSIAP